MDVVKKEWLETVRLLFVSLYGIILDVVGAKNGLWVMIIYHSYLPDKTGFLEDLFRQTKAGGAIQGGRIIDVAFTLIKIQLLIVAFSFGRYDFLKNARSNIMESEHGYHRK